MTEDNKIKNVKTPFGQSVFQRFVMRYDQDVFLSVLHRELAKIYEKAVPLRWVIKEDCTEIIYTKEAQEMMDFYKGEIKKRHIELAKLFSPGQVSA